MKVKTMNEAMQANISDRRWACPGFFRMPETGDGGICRIKLPLGQVSPMQLRTIAEGAKEFGNKIIELTNRSNFQIRGVMPAMQASLSALLLEAGLGPDTPQGDDIRNVMINPTAGFDRTTLIDTCTIGDKLLDLLQHHEDYTLLSPKFAFYIDGGEESAYLDHSHDIWLSAVDHEHFVFGFASSPHSYEKNMAIGKINANDALSFIKASLDLFLKFQKNDATIQRFKHLFSRLTRFEFAEKLKEEGMAIASAADFHCRKTAPLAHLGKNAQIQPGFFYISALPPLGRILPQTLEKVAALAENISHSEQLRLTPWRGLIIPYCNQEQAANTLKELSDLGFAVSSSDPYAHIINCAGAPFCRSAHSNVQRDAKRLAQLMKGYDFEPVHLTACSKSCASTNPYAMTLLAQSDGIYTLYQDKEAGQEKFGQVLADAITIEQAAVFLKQADNDR